MNPAPIFIFNIAMWMSVITIVIGLLANWEYKRINTPMEFIGEAYGLAILNILLSIMIAIEIGYFK